MYIPNDIYEYFVEILPLYYFKSFRQLNNTFKKIFEEFYKTKVILVKLIKHYESTPIMHRIGLISHTNNFKLTYGDSVELLKKNKLKIEDKKISLYVTQFGVTKTISIYSVIDNLL